MAFGYQVLGFGSGVAASLTLEIEYFVLKISFFRNLRVSLLKI